MVIEVSYYNKLKLQFSVLEIRRLKHVPRFVDKNSLKTLASFFIIYKENNVIVIFLKSQTISNWKNYRISLLRLFWVNTFIHDHGTLCLINLHCLSIKFRIYYKMAITVFKCIHGLAPDYLWSLIETHRPSRNLRFSK